jgi:hypothetical protein
MFWDTPTWSTACRLDAGSAGIDVTHGAATSLGTTVISPGTTYHIWVEWTKGTGSNGTMKLFISANGVKPAQPEASLSAGTGGATENIYIGPLSAGPNVIIDRLLVDDVEIGGNP